MYKKDLYGKTIRKKIVFHGGFYMFGLIIALISGALMSIQGVFNTEVTKQSSTWTTSTFVQATGFLACLLIWLKCCFLADRGFRSVGCGKNSFCMGKAFRSGFVCHRIDNI